MENLNLKDEELKQLIIIGSALSVNPKGFIKFINLRSARKVVRIENLLRKSAYLRNKVYNELLSVAKNLKDKYPQRFENFKRSGNIMKVYGFRVYPSLINSAVKYLNK